MALNFTANLTETEPSPVKAVIISCMGVLGLCVNSLVIPNLRHCELTYITQVLMTSQCAFNIVGLIPITFYVPVVLATDKAAFTTPFIRLLPGAFENTGILGSMSIQTCMAINRLVTIGYFEKAVFWFTDKRTYVLLASVASFVGVTTILYLLPCCGMEYQPDLKTWYYIGSGKQAMETTISIISMVFIMSLVICYPWSLVKMKRFRQAISSQELAQQNAKREVNTLIQFCIIGCMWVVGFSVWILIQQVGDELGEALLQFADIQYTVLFTMDPVVYLTFMKLLRKAVRHSFTCNKDEVRPLVSQVGTAVTDRDL